MRPPRVEIEAFDFIDRINAARNADDVYSLLAGEFEKFGFTNFLITDMPPPQLGLESSLILNGWSKEWFDRYMAENFYRHDPMAKQTRETIDPFFWHDIETKTELDEHAQRVMKEAGDFGLRKGFSVPIFGVAGDQSCVTMGGEKLDIPPRGREALHLMSIYAHDRARALGREWANARAVEPSLTPREREVLKWVARGKTDWEIGEILNISHETAFAHVRNSCHKLDAVTRTQAVVIAMQRGEITV